MLSINNPTVRSTKYEKNVTFSYVKRWKNVEILDMYNRVKYRLDVAQYNSSKSDIQRQSETNKLRRSGLHQQMCFKYKTKTAPSRTQRM